MNFPKCIQEVHKKKKQSTKPSKRTSPNWKMDALAEKTAQQDNSRRKGKQPNGNKGQIRAKQTPPKWDANCCFLFDKMAACDYDMRACWKTQLYHKSKRSPSALKLSKLYLVYLIHMSWSVKMTAQAPRFSAVLSFSVNQVHNFLALASYLMNKYVHYLSTPS